MLHLFYMRQFKEGDLEKIRLLLKLGADPSIADDNGDTIFTLAEKKNDQETIRVLTEK